METGSLRAPENGWSAELPGLPLHVTQSQLTNAHMSTVTQVANARRDPRAAWKFAGGDFQQQTVCKTKTNFIEFRAPIEAKELITPLSNKQRPLTNSEKHETTSLYDEEWHDETPYPTAVNLQTNSREKIRKQDSANSCKNSYNSSKTSMRPRCLQRRCQKGNLACTWSKHELGRFEKSTKLQQNQPNFRTKMTFLGRPTWWPSLIDWSTANKQAM